MSNDFQKNKNKIVIIFVIFLSFLVIGGSLFYWQNKNKESSHENNDTREVVNVNVNENENNNKNDNKNNNENINVNEKNNEKNDNDKVNKKEENKDKPKEIKNEEEKKPEEKDNVDQNNENKDNQEETDDLPWMFTQKGIVSTIVVSGFLGRKTYNLISIRYPSLQFNDANGWRKVFNTLLFVLILLVFQQVFSPLFLAMKGYKNKSYWERFKFIGKKIFWTCVKFIDFVFLIVIIIEVYRCLSTR